MNEFPKANLIEYFVRPLRNAAMGTSFTQLGVTLFLHSTQEFPTFQNLTKRYSRIMRSLVSPLDTGEGRHIIVYNDITHADRVSKLLSTHGLTQN